MSQYVDAGEKSFRAGGAIPQFGRVHISAAKTVSLSGITEVGIGIAMREAFAAGDEVPVKLWSAQGTFPMIAAGAISVNGVISTAADGEGSATAASTSYPLARAVTASGADGDIIETLPQLGEVAAT